MLVSSDTTDAKSDRIIAQGYSQAGLSIDWSFAMTIRELLEYVCAYESTNNPLDTEIVILQEGISFTFMKERMSIDSPEADVQYLILNID